MAQVCEEGGGPVRCIQRSFSCRAAVHLDRVIQGGLSHISGKKKCTSGGGWICPKIHSIPALHYTGTQRLKQEKIYTFWSFKVFFNWSSINLDILTITIREDLVCAERNSTNIKQKRC